MGRKEWIAAVPATLAAYAARYRSLLQAQSYSPSSISNRLWQFAQLSRWLAEEARTVDGLTDAQCERFVASRRAAGQVTMVARQA
jgi:hypothetical protein